MSPPDVISADLYRAELTDAGYWRRRTKCQDHCPVHTDARGYVWVIADGDYRLARLIAGRPIPRDPGS
jgi:hypothetical protein